MRDVIESQIHEIENNWLDQLFVNKSLLKTIFDSIPVGIGLSAFPPNSGIFMSILDLLIYLAILLMIFPLSMIGLVLLIQIPIIAVFLINYGSK